VALTEVNESGGYSFIPSRGFASGGVVASPGMTIVRAAFAAPMLLPEGFDAVRRQLDGAGRPLEALCGFELRMPQALSWSDFEGFNEGYLKQLDDWGLLREGASPLARTNVVPTGNQLAGAAVTAFSYTVQSSRPAAAFVISGVPELPEGYRFPDDIVRPGETSRDALIEKMRCVVDVIASRATTLGASWDDDASVHLYSQEATALELQRELLAADGIIPAHGIIWHDSVPPIVGLELEIDVRRYDSEVMLQPAPTT
jgi:hypothetical protein